MLSETGRVVAIDEGGVWVETLRQSTCGKCVARSGCGHGMLNTALPGGSRGLIKARLPEESPLLVQLHDTVEISLPERSFLSGVAMLYFVPLLMTVLGAALADGYLVLVSMDQAMADLRVGVGAGLGLASGLLLLRVFTQRNANDQRFQPRVTARLPQPGEPSNPAPISSAASY
ncbi:MAG: SoxR reducing system RseC family protein [Congregibacter sp.]